MTIWMYYESLTPEEEAHIRDRKHLALPFEDLPDLSMIKNPVECRHLLQALHPDDPPETIARKTERIWKLYGTMQVEDIIAVPLPSRKEVAIAEVKHPYHYMVDTKGNDVHRIIVKWHKKRAKFRAFKRHPEALHKGSEKISEVKKPALRAIIRDRLPHSYNRFAKWKWLLAVLFIIGMLSRAEQLIRTLMR